MTNNLATAYAVPSTCEEALALDVALAADRPETVTLHTAHGAILALITGRGGDPAIHAPMTAADGHTYDVCADLFADGVLVRSAQECPDGPVLMFGLDPDPVFGDFEDALAEAWLVPETLRTRRLMAAVRDNVSVVLLLGHAEADDPRLEVELATLRRSLCQLAACELAEGTPERLAADALADGWTGTPAELLMAARTVGAPTSRAAT